MQRRTFPILLLAASAVPTLLADVTIRSENQMKFGAVIPAPVAERTQNGRETALPDSAVIYRKGSQEYLASGKFACLLNFTRQEITIIDAAHKQFATLPMKNYVDRLAAAMPPMPAEFRSAQESAKTTLTSRKTGRKDVMRGVQVEETEYIASLDIPVPAGAAITQAGPLLKVTMQVWMAQPAEASSVPALRELAAYSFSDARFSQWTDPANILATIFGAMPGLGDGVGRIFQEIEKNKSVVFKSHLEASMPGMASFLQQMQRQRKDLPDALDPNAPFSVIESDLVELSTAPVDDTVFQLPADYHAAPFEDVVKALSPGYPKS